MENSTFEARPYGPCARPFLGRWKSVQISCDTSCQGYLNDSYTFSHSMSSSNISKEQKSNLRTSLCCALKGYKESKAHKWNVAQDAGATLLGARVSKTKYKKKFCWQIRQKNQRPVNKWMRKAFGKFGKRGGFQKKHRKWGSKSWLRALEKSRTKGKRYN